MAVTIPCKGEASKYNTQKLRELESIRSRKVRQTMSLQRLRPILVQNEIQRLHILLRIYTFVSLPISQF
jgi:hypothetical protein